ncbi:MAG: hypothetical protein WC565_07570 [Parcubacteria group bacterium]
MKHDELLAIGVHHLTRAARANDRYALAVCLELVRLYQASGEPVPDSLREFLSDDGNSCVTMTQRGGWIFVESQI